MSPGVEMSGARVVSPALIAELRQLTEDAVLCDVDDAGRRRLEELIAQARSVLGERVRSRIVRAPFGRIAEHRVHDRPWVTDSGNPVLPQLEVSFGPSRAHARWQGGALYEGPPGMLHGGISAHLLDVMCGVLLQSLDLRAVTAGLELRYRHPVPLDLPLELHSELLESQGRKHRLRARIEAEGRTAVTAEGLFISTSA